VAGLRAGQVQDALGYIGNLTKENKFGIPVGSYTGTGNNLLSQYSNQYSTDKQYDLGLQQLQSQNRQADKGFWGDMFQTLGGLAASASKKA
jgi:hypothetical protein